MKQSKAAIIGFCSAVTLAFAHLTQTANAAPTTPTVATLAGSGGSGSTDATGSTASFHFPVGVAADASGNVYVADYGNNKIRLVSPAGVVTTLAGSGAQGSADAAGTAASFSSPWAVAVVASGNVYVADKANNKIRMITPAGVVTTLAGSGIKGARDGTGTAASFNNPTGVAVDASGDVYVADYGNNEIRLITSTGVVTTLAGSGSSGSTDGTGTAASFFGPTGVALDAAGDLYVADTDNDKIRKISSAGVVTTLAGSGSKGATDATGTAASFYYPSGVAVDATGNVYVADEVNNKIRNVSPTGVVTTLAGTGIAGSTDGTGTAASFDSPAGVAVDTTGNVYVADEVNCKIRKIALPLQSAPLITWPAPTAISYGTALSLAQLDATANVPGTFAYTPAAGTVLDVGSQTLSVTFTPTDTVDYSIKTVTQTLTVNQAVPVITWAAPTEITSGTALSSAQLDATANTEGAFVYTPAAGTVPTTGSQTLSVVFSPTDTTRYTSATATQTLLVDVVPVAPSADAAGDVITTRFTAIWNAVAGAAGYRLDVSTNSSFSSFVAGYQSIDVGNVTSANVSGLSANTTYYYRVEAYDSTGAGTSSGTITVTTTPPANITTPLTVSTLAGEALAYGTADGTGTGARFYYPSGIATDTAGNVYVADTDNQIIRKVTASGVVTTLAGLAQVSGSTDGTGTAARFQNPSGVAVDASGNVYVADTLNNTLRKVTPSGVVTTLAGTSGASGSVDDTGTKARFYGPQGMAIDSSGNLYVADTNNHTIRKIVPSSGSVATVAGLAGNSGSSDGLGIAARFNSPSGVTVDTAGDLYVVDADNETIRKILPSGLVSTIAGLAGNSGGADGTGSAARFDSPSAVTIDTSGNVYIADTGNFTIRMLLPATGATSTIAGLAGTSGRADGSGSVARFFQPAGIAVDTSSNLYIADTNNHTIRLGVLLLAPSIQAQPQNQTVTAGSSAQFSVTASGRPTPMYVWNFNGTAISGATGAAYTISSAQSSNAGTYTVTVTNSLGSVTSNSATLTVNPTTPSASGGGGGAPSWWFVLAVALVGIARWVNGHLHRPLPRGQNSSDL
jgi:streptogramin lyase